MSLYLTSTMDPNQMPEAPGEVTLSDGAAVYIGSRDAPLNSDSATATPAEKKERQSAEIKLGQKRKYAILFIFGVAQYLDIAGYAGLYIFTEPMLQDLKILYESSSWIITAYSVTFAASLLLMGRLSDLYSAKPVFDYGFLGLGITNLIISFLPEKYSYFIFRAISGIFGAATLPSAFRLILAIFEREELNFALTIFGLSGALANVTGMLFAGIFGYITASGQMSAWRWFFRWISIISIPFSVLSFLLVPRSTGHDADKFTPREKLKRLDLPGCLAMFISITLLILGLTLGASYGFKTVKFLVPFLLSWPIAIGFFFWEKRLPEGFALIPPSFWRIPNMTLLTFFTLAVYPWWAVNQLPFIERFTVLYDEQPLLAAVRILPQGISSFIVALFVPALFARLRNPKWAIAFGSLVAGCSYLLFIYSGGEIYHGAYWRWLVPAGIIGSGGSIVTFLGANIIIMTSVPPHMAGVAGALFQVSLQLGTVIGLSIQAGLLTLHPGSFYDFSNVQASFWFQCGWHILNCLLIVLFFSNKGIKHATAAAM